MKIYSQVNHDANVGSLELTKERRITLIVLLATVGIDREIHVYSCLVTVIHHTFLLYRTADTSL
jgi:hypothetical protein